MDEQVSNAVTFLFFYTENKVGKTGLTVTVDVWKIAQTGSASEIITGGSATEMGDGLYLYVLGNSNTADVGDYVAVGKTATTTVDQQHIPSLWSIGRGGVEYLSGDVYGVVTHATYGLDKLARTGADSDTLETLSDQIDGVALEATVMKAASYVAPPSTSEVAGAVWDADLSEYEDEGTAGKTLSDLSTRISEQVPGDDPVLVIPAPPDTTTTVAWVRCWDAHGQAQSGVKISMVLRGFSGRSGEAFSHTVITAVSNAEGIASVFIPRGAELTFEAWREGGPPVIVSGVDEDQLELPALLGKP